MAHINSIGTALYSDLSFSIGTTKVPATYDAAGFASLFTTKDDSSPFTEAAGAFIRVKNVREFPAMGTPANIVNVPVFGQKISSTVQGQADAPSLEVTLNYVPSDWDATAGLGQFINDGVERAFRFTLLNADPGAAATWASSSAGFGNKQHSVFYWVGKMEAIQVTPSLSDATTATLTLSIQSDFYGAFTHA